MSAKYVQRGEVLDYKNGTTDTIKANTIMKFGGKVGVIGGDIPPNEVGAIHMVGVFEMPKVDSTEVMGLGQNVYLDEDAITTAESGNTLVGYTVTESVATQLTVIVKLVG